MSDTWFTSDTHFFHKRIHEFCPSTRAGASVEEMHEIMVQEHNRVVRPNDTVYYLGDLTFERTGPDGHAHGTVELLKRLSGRKHLILGNHDQTVHKDYNVRAQFDSIHQYRRIRMAGQTVVLFHYPMREWEKMHHGAYHLFGHVHGDLVEHPHGRSMDVGVDARPDNLMRPFNWDEVHLQLSQAPILQHHNRLGEPA